MASILLLSEKGRVLSLAGRLKNEGHIVKVFIAKGDERVLKGSRNPSRIEKPDKMLEQYDLILGEPTMTSPLEAIREKGKTVMGNNLVTSKLMFDQEYQQKVLQYLYGPREDLEGLQVRLTGFMGPKGFSSLMLLSLPQYYFMDGSKGALTEGMGSLSLFPDKDSRVLEVLHPFEEYLLKANYQGPFSLSLTIKGELWNIRSVDTQFIPEDLLAGAELIKCSLFEFLFDLLEEGKKGEAWKGLGISVVASVPPWPYLGAPIEGDYIRVPEPARKHFSPADLWCGVLGVASARGEDIREARRRVYRTLENSIESRDVQYREDIGLEAEKDLEALRGWGWLI